MKFQKGVSGNPNGKPKGALSRKTRFQKALAQFDGEHVGNLLTSLYEEGVKGDITATKIFLEYVLPKADKQIELGFDIQETAENPFEHLSDIQMKGLGEIMEGVPLESICPCCHPNKYALWMSKEEKTKYGVPLEPNNAPH